MRAFESEPGRSANNATAACGSETSFTAASGSDLDPEWFFTVATDILGNDAGLALHYITGYPERSCYAYVARDPDKRRRPPLHFFECLFSKPEGEPFFNAWQRRIGSLWWQERERARRVGEAALRAAE